MNKTTTIIGLVILIVIVGFALLRRGIQAIPAALIGTQFPGVDWGDESVADILSANPEVLSKAWISFNDQVPDIEASNSLVEVGMLTVPTGTILATDLNFVEDNRPFRRPIPVGEYSVYEFRSAFGVMAIVLIAPDKSPASWVIADAFGDDNDDLQDPEGLTGVSIDSSAILVDAVVCTKQSKFNPLPMINQETLSIVVDPASGANAVCVELGGVGVHKAYWALDDSGQPMALVVIGN